jgi:hypothetical protein
LFNPLATGLPVLTPLFTLDVMSLLVSVPMPGIIVLVGVSSRLAVVSIAPVSHRFDRHHSPDKHSYQNKDRCFHSLLLFLVNGSFPFVAYRLPPSILIFIRHRVIFDPMSGLFCMISAGCMCRGEVAFSRQDDFLPVFNVWIKLSVVKILIREPCFCESRVI